jgi:hypothetical protein
VCVFAASVCPLLEPVPATPWNGTAVVVQEGDVFGHCIGRQHFEVAPSCPEVKVLTASQSQTDGIPDGHLPLILSITNHPDFERYTLNVTFSRDFSQVIQVKQCQTFNAPKLNR